MTALKYIAALIIMTAAAMLPLHFVRFPARSEVDGAEQTAAKPVVRRVRIVALGDLMQHTPQVTAARTPRGGYDYTRSFRHLAHLTRQADLAIVNLETTLSEEGPYAGYPCFRSPAAVADAMRDMQIDLAVMANNHCCDRGSAGIRATTNILDSRGIRRTGVFRDSTDMRLNNLQYITRNGITFAVINYTYGTNGLPVPEGCIVNRIDTAVIARDIAAIDRGRADCVIAFMHWGNEYQRHPDAVQRATADFLHRHGVEIVIGSHPHVIQSVECDRQNGVTVYSLGNLVSNQRKRYCDGGIAATIDVEMSGDGKLSYSLHVTPLWVHTPDYAILPPEVADTMRMTPPDRQRYELFIDDTRQLLGL